MKRLVARFFRQEEGMAAVLIALSMTVLLGFTAMVVDAGVLFVERTTLQKAVDAAALAGAKALWPGGTGMAADALYYAAQNGVDPSVDPNTTITYNGNPSATVWNPPSEAWQVTATRQVNLAFAPLLGLSQSTVTATATAINSPLASIEAPYVLPYAIWGGNNPTGGQGPNGPCCDPPPPPVPGPYNWITLPNSGADVVYRDNQWASLVVFPDANNCGGKNQPSCNANWNVGPQVSFKGFFNQMQGQLTTGLNSNLASQSGNASEPFSLICQTLTKNPPVAIMPVASWAQENSGVISFYIPYFVGIRLDSIAGCNGGKSMGTNFTGVVLDKWFTSHGKGHGPSTSPVHVLQLWR